MIRFGKVTVEMVLLATWVEWLKNYVAETKHLYVLETTFE